MEEHNIRIIYSSQNKIYFCGNDLSVYFEHTGNKRYDRLIQTKDRSIIALKCTGEIEFFDRATGNIKYIQKVSNWGHNLCELPSGELAIQDDSPTYKIHIWGQITGNTGNIGIEERFRCRGFLSGHEDFIQCIKVHSTGLIMTSSYDKSIRIWHITNKRVSNSVRILKDEENPLDCTSNIEELENSNSLIIAVCFWMPKVANALRIWDITTSLILCKVFPPDNELFGFNCSVLNKSNQTILLGGICGNIVVFDLSSKQFILNYKAYNSNITLIHQLSQTKVISGSSDKEIKIINILNSTEEKKVLISPNSMILV